MILPDINILVYAYRRESPAHERYAAWLSDLVSGADEMALVESTLTGFLRIVTNRRIFPDPAPMLDPAAFVDGLRRARRRRWLAMTEAWLAALAVSHGCRLATADRGFARFD